MILTIGHSSRTATAFLELLTTHRVSALADVRAIPRSRRYSHFSKGVLASLLDAHHIAYRHFPELGGMRAPRSDSINGALRVAAFRGYADYMRTKAFRAALDDLVTFSQDGVVAIMCAEANWWECHRQFLADALVAAGVEVRHIMTQETAPHELTATARVDGRDVSYPSLL